MNNDDLNQHLMGELFLPLPAFLDECMEEYDESEFFRLMIWISENIVSGFEGCLFSPEIITVHIQQNDMDLLAAAGIEGTGIGTNLLKAHLDRIWKDKRFKILRVEFCGIKHDSDKIDCIKVRIGHNTP